MVSETRKLAERACRYALLAALLASVAFEAVALASQVLCGFLGDRSPLVDVIGAESSLFYATADSAPVLVSIFFFCWAPLFVIRAAAVRTRPGFGQGLPRKTFEELVTPSRLDRYWAPLVLISLFSVLTVTLYPYLPALNAWGKFVGVDIPFYHEGLLDLAGAGDPLAIIKRALASYGDRPLSFLILISVWRLTWLQPMVFVQFYPVLLGVALVSAVFLSSRLIGLSRFYSSLAMLLTSFSFHVTTGMYGGFIANWTALVLLYPFWGLTCAAVRKKSWAMIVAASAVGILIVLAHAYTGAMNLGVLLVFVLISAVGNLRRKEGRLEFLIPALLLVLAVLPLLLVSLVADAGLAGDYVYRAVLSGFSAGNLQAFQSNLLKSVMTYKGLTFVNPPMLAISLVGISATLFSEHALSRVLKAFAVGSSIPFLVGNYVMQSRILYNIPFQVFGSVGLVFLFVAIRRLNLLGGGSRWQGAVVALIAVLFVLVNLNYALRCSFILTTINFFPGSMM